MFYSVHKGNVPGIYDTWEECKKSIFGYKKPIYRKFIEYKDAVDFYEKGNNNDTIYKFIFDINSHNINDFKLIFTDGGCINNGKENSKAAYGVFFDEDHPLNTSVLLEGKQTNNSAELNGIVYALENIHTFINENIKICIITDSDYCLKVIKKYVSTSNNIDFNKLTNVPNIILIQKIFNLIYKNDNINYSIISIDNMLKFKHIYSHTGLSDKLSIGNEKADKLVSNALNNNNTNPHIKKRIYINVPFNLKDEAKTYGAKWDFKKKKWFIFDDLDEVKKTYLIKKFING